jgi:TRAP transporter TAXI family solute receptor
MMGSDHIIMKPRIAALTAIGSLSVLVLALLVAAVGFGEAQTIPARVAFLIATGPTDGTYFPVGQTIAGIISNPPGVDRCQIPNACGPQGLIMSARSSDGAVANVLAVDHERVDSGLAQADVVSEAVAGKGIFRRDGRQSHIRVLADLFSEDMHLVVARKTHIAKVTDLVGKTVSIGPESSGTLVTTRAILAAYGLSEHAMHVRHDPSDVAAQHLENGKLDAFFFVGGTPVPMIEDLVSRGVARLVPIDGNARKRLTKLNPSLEPDTIPANTYSGTPAMPTVKVRALWIVRDTTPAPLVYGIVKALYNSSNRAQLDQAMPATRAIRIDTATKTLPAPLHPGAQRFYQEVGVLRK